MSTESSVTVSNAALPSRQGRTSLPTGNSDTAQQQLAWQREMERAQLMGWFKPVSVDTRAAAAESADRSIDGRARGKGDSKQRSGSGRTWQASQPGAGGLPPAAAPGSPIVSPGGERSIGVSVFAIRSAVSLSIPPSAAVEVEPAVANDLRIDARLAHRQGTQAGTGLPTEAPAQLEDGADAAPDAFQAEAREQLAPLRLHEEATPEGQAIWIAMRADDEALAAMLPRLVADLQHGLLERGQRLHQVVCNGRLVWHDRMSALPDDKLISRIDNRRAISDSIDPKEA
ncbi:hypothetical protein [Variovorax sp. YR566]|uniref:hypothetical protein n=1 Tax=Variovorax sp. YR566 TaxID=3450237 RepID=UPI003F8212AA